MNKLVATLLMIGAASGGGCANSTLVVGQQRAAIDSEDVVVYFYERPHCAFETIAWIELRHGYFSMGRLLADMRRAAADVGAGGLYLLQSQQLSLGEYAGRGKAIRCLSG